MIFSSGLIDAIYILQFVSQNALSKIVIQKGVIFLNK